ncbi:MAG: restriction endonuclease subunit S [Candidatus Melainabacteria bacterium]|nr:restriction endonuclease subunit S [Candidatus Melainabacteria bacterium]
MTRPVPHGWQEDVLGNVAFITTGSKDVNHGSPSGKYPFFTCGQAIQRIEDYSFDTEALLIAGNGFFNIKYFKGKFDAYQRTYVLDRFNQNPYYLHQYLAFYLDNLTGNNQGSTIKYIKLGDLKNFPILLPTLPEQEGIAAVLGSVDATIDATKQVIAQTRQLKRAVMQTLLTRGLPGQHTQFKPSPLGTLPADWEVVKLGSLTTEIRYGTSVNCTSDSGSGIPILRIPNVVLGEIDIQNLKYTSLLEAEKRRITLKSGDMLFIRTNGNPDYVGRCAIFNEKGCYGYASYLIRVRLDTNKISPEFMKISLELEATKKSLNEGIRTSAGNYNLNTQGLSNAWITLPPLPEQEAIVGILNTVDARLARETETLTRLQTLKTALMQVLLTGEVRVPVALGVSRPAEYGETSPIAVREIVRQGSR